MAIADQRALPVDRKTERGLDGGAVDVPKATSDPDRAVKTSAPKLPGQRRSAA